MAGYSQQRQYQQYQRPQGGNVNVNVDSAKNKRGKKDDFTGGEYIDYEEVK
jgi:hypothetical protein